MSQDGINREFDILVCCSLMFLGNSFSAAKQILGRVFFPAGIHFVVVEDAFCSIGKTCDEVNAYLEASKTEYLRKISTATCSNYLEACKYKFYGYIWQPDGSLVIDSEPAEVIRKIFSLYIKGVSITGIAKKMNEDGVETTVDYRARKNGHDYVYQGNPWRAATVGKILGWELYAGKWERKIGDQHTTIDVPAIVSRDEFKLTNALRDEKRKTRNTRNSYSQALFSGLIWDAKTGEPLIVESKRTNGEEIYRTCKTTRRDVIFNQGQHIKSDQVLEVVVKALLDEKNLADKTVAYISSEEGKQQKNQLIETTSDEMKKIFSKMVAVDQQIYSDPNSSSSLDEMNRLQTKMKALEGHVDELEIKFSEKNPWIMFYRNLVLPSQYSNAFFRKTIEQIQVKNFQDVLVKMRFEEWKIAFWSTCPKVREA